MALIVKYGYESRNQSCTFALIENLIEEGKITYLNKEDLKEIFDKDITSDIEHSDKILDLREKIQYSTQTSLEEEEFMRLKKKVKELFDKIRKEIEKE